MAFFLFPQSSFKQKFCHCSHAYFVVCKTDASNTDKSDLVNGKGINLILNFVMSRIQKLNLFPNKPWFLHVCSTCLGEKKLLLTSSFPFRTVFSILSENFLPFSSNLKLSSANTFSLEESKICHLGKD